MDLCATQKVLLQRAHSLAVMVVMHIIDSLTTRWTTLTWHVLPLDLPLQAFQALSDLACMHQKHTH